MITNFPRTIGDPVVLAANELTGHAAIEGTIVAIHTADTGRTVYTIEVESVDTLARCYKEGQQAAKERQTCGVCPYSYVAALAAGCPDQLTFDSDWRPLFNAWFDGWTAQLKDDGLDFSMRPLKRKATIVNKIKGLEL